jgi:hypothetical protein
MTLASLSTSLAGVTAAAAVVLSGATIWLLWTDPLTVASAVQDGSLTPLVKELARAITEALRGLLRYL